MRVLHEQDFDRMAEAAVDRFMGGEKLADAATAEAMGGQLGPDQIERLVQAANTQAFLRLMEQQKGQAPEAGPDMTHEFDPIDARQVLQQIMGHVDVPHVDGAAGAAPAMPGDDSAPLPDETGAPDAPETEIEDTDGPFPKGSKDKATKKKPPAKAEKKAFDTATNDAFRARRQQKLADVLADQYKQAEWAFEDTFKLLETTLKQAHGGPSWDAFEKDATAMHGDEYGASVLNMVRGARRLEPLSVAEVQAKHAALADRHIVDDTAALRHFTTLVKIATEAGRLQRGVTYLRSQCV